MPLLATGVITFLLVSGSHGYMSPMCCGDNFCCAVKTDATVDCWGGNSFTTVVSLDSSVDDESDLSDVKYIACAGKSLVAVGDGDELIAVMGKTGYGADSFDENDLGTTVTDVSVSFWGGAFIASDGTLTAWSESVTFASSSSSQSWYPAADTSGASCGCTTASRSMALTAPSGTFSMVACGGKRAGHFCCGVLASSDTTGGDATQCFGDGAGTYTPLASELSSQGLLDATLHSISAGCDFLCVLTTDGTLGVYEHSSEQLSSYADLDTNGLDLEQGTTGLDTSGAEYAQVACGTFGVYTLDAEGASAARGRRYSRHSAFSGSVPLVSESR